VGKLALIDTYRNNILRKKSEFAYSGGFSTPLDIKTQ
jgi:hypothetical protein